MYRATRPGFGQAAEFGRFESALIGRVTDAIIRARRANAYSRERSRSIHQTRRRDGLPIDSSTHRGRGKVSQSTRTVFE